MRSHHHKNDALRKLSVSHKNSFKCQGSPVNWKHGANLHDCRMSAHNTRPHSCLTDGCFALWLELVDWSLSWLFLYNFFWRTIELLLKCDYFVRKFVFVDERTVAIEQIKCSYFCCFTQFPTNFMTYTMQFLRNFTLHSLLLFEWFYYYLYVDCPVCSLLEWKI